MNAIIMDLRASSNAGFKEGGDSSTSSAADLEKIKELTTKLDEATAEIESQKSKSSSSSSADLEKIKELTAKLDEATAEIETQKKSNYLIGLISFFLTFFFLSLIVIHYQSIEELYF
ncbi:hypothetical protein M1146_04770 [Patescibacteria group bacterium]|nr:hypothetical protein [Patescibacteria group bacterium]